MGIPGPIHFYQASAEDRIAEIGRILARGLIRLRARQSSPNSAHRGESSLDFPPDQSGVANISIEGSYRE